MNTSEIVLRSNREINNETYITLNKYLGRGQVTYLDLNTLRLTKVNVVNDFSYNLIIKDTYDDSDVSFIFSVFKLEDGLHILYIRHDFHHYIEVKETIGEVRVRYNWFLKMMINFHQDVLLAKRGN
ncbi:hypothetical protein [Bacillus pinisoli]|uniref:hypothetical protein n=1 Tax=Bacillus pinisoli TaxID=2901866 RepID=UPI001FF3DEF9|nr:hypothetical protein [Bacillus pinisoli]